MVKFPVKQDPWPFKILEWLLMAALLAFAVLCSFKNVARPDLSTATIQGSSR